ncbi:MAG: hypothetical protein VX828_08080 [Candidatus Thermoplasmatota archaeon]|nr:hypothetical protein [Candidatus Thalassarchaeum sp.]MED6298242.1 hypothetical protein [Candidatus Thermoplasmatota archaeon]|tara:strand:- start:748 stop:1413 length:666 start_codon:yes stop_codon:yes gene_type:complete
MRREVVYILTICIGLWVDQNGTEWPLKGEYIVDIVVWSIFATIYARGDRVERIEMLTVLAFATPMELFFTEVWHLYEYREGMMPLFVPAGHWFLFDLGRRFSKHLPEHWAWPSIVPFVPLSIYFAYQGIDTSGLLLLVALFGFMQWGPERRLYATMAWLALAMELWGTHLGNWAWYAEVPWTPLTAWNPPLLCGVVYALGDLLVNITVNQFTDQNDELRKQ